MRGWFFFAPATTLGAIAVFSALAAIHATTAEARGKAANTVPNAVIVPGPERTAIDWSRGLITAVGAAAGDLRAPSPAIARVAAKRKALDQARARLDSRARALTLGTRPVAEHIENNAPARARLERALQHVVELDVSYGSDGSVVVTAGLPLEAIRLAVHGPPRPAPAERENSLPTAVIIDARKVMNTPILGVALNTPAGPRAAPTVFYRSVKAARADARLGQRAISLTAARLDKADAVLQVTAPGKKKGDVIDSLVSLDSLDQALETGALVVIVIGK
jgi:hypothetical protein